MRRIKVNLQRSFTLLRNQVVIDPDEPALLETRRNGKHDMQNIEVWVAEA